LGGQVKRILLAALLCTTALSPTTAAADPVSASILGAAFATFGPGGTVISIGSLALGSFGSFLFRAVLGLALNALTPRPRAPTRGYQVTAFGSALDHQIIYGETKIAGARVFDASTGANNTFLHRAVIFAGHEVEEFTEVWLNDYKLTVNLTTGAVTSAENAEETTTRFNSRVRIIARNGTDDQTAIPEMVSEVPEWTSHHRLQGLAYLYIRLQFDADVFPNGIPEITATVKGRKVYDPRTDTVAWSDNPALCVRDYLTASFGLGAPESEIDDVLAAQAANVCDQTVEGEKRFTCNGAFLTDAQPGDVVERLLTSMGGLLWHAQGRWRMKPAYYTSPVLSLGEDDLRGGLRVQTRAARRENFNTVRGTWRGAESNWQVTDYKPVSDPAFLNADGGIERAADIDLAFTSSHLTAQRIARIALRQQREQIAVSGNFGMRAFAVQVGDVVQLTNSRMGWTNKEFEVTSWTFAFTDDLALEVQMSLRETSSAIYTQVSGAVFEKNNTRLPSPYFVPGVGLNASILRQVSSEKVTNIILLDVTTATPAFLDHVEVQFRETGATDWIAVGSGEPGRFEIVDVDFREYDLRARGVNTLGVKGAWAVLPAFDVSGAATPPSDVTGLAADVSGGVVTLSWTPVPDFDLSHYIIRHAVEESGANWADATTAAAKVSRPATEVTLPVKPGTYMIRAEDKGGLRSTNFASVVVPADALETFTTTETQAEHPTFSGTKSGVMTENDALFLSGDVNGTKMAEGVLRGVGFFEPERTRFVDTEPVSGRSLGDVDGGGSVGALDALYILNWVDDPNSVTAPQKAWIEDTMIPFMLANPDIYGEYLVYGTIPATGTYTFSAPIDTAAARRFRARVDLATRRAPSEFGEWDNLPGLFDSLPGLFDDFTGTPLFDDTNVVTYISLTDDDPAGTPTWGDWQRFKSGDYYARAARFRAELQSFSENATPRVLELTAIVQHD